MCARLSGSCADPDRSVCVIILVPNANTVYVEYSLVFYIYEGTWGILYYDVNKRDELANSCDDEKHPIPVISDQFVLVQTALMHQVVDSIQQTKDTSLRYKQLRRQHVIEAPPCYRSWCLWALV